MINVVPYFFPYGFKISGLTLFLVEVKDKKESIVATYFTKMTKMIPWRAFMSFY